MRFSDVLGKPIVSAETGAQLGVVEDLLLDHLRRQVIGVLVGSALLPKQHVLLFTQVQTVGSDAIVAHPASPLIEAQKLERYGTAASRSSCLRGKHVVSAWGDRLGTVSDVFADQHTGRVFAVEIATEVGGFRTRRSMLATGDDVNLANDVVVVPRNVVERLRAADARADPGRLG